jgi:TRAP-type C4-dicarboxylate transport system substrate-binding protein
VSVPSRPIRAIARAATASLLLWLAMGSTTLAELDAAMPQRPLRLPVVGSLSGVRLYEEFEVPFWRAQLLRLTDGAVQADIVSVDSSGVRGQDLLHLARLGVIPFATVPLGLATNDEPELGAPNLAMLAPDLGTLRRMVQAYRPHLAAVLQQRYGVELLAVYAYPAQVLFCAAPLPGLSALRGRRVRVSQASQADMVQALGGQPLLTPYGQLRDELSGGRADCAITGSFTGNQLGLHEVATQVHGMPVGWGLSVFAANEQAWAGLPDALKPMLRRGLAGLEQEVWAAAAQDTEDGFLCNAGHEGCRSGTRGRLRWEAPGADDETMRRRLLAEVVVPGWIARCGEECRVAWNAYLAPMTRIVVPAADGASPSLAQPRVELLTGAGSQATTAGLAASMIAPASSSTSSR